MDVAKELRKLRKRAGLTQVELGERARLSGATVGLIEGGHIPTASTLSLLASALGLPADYFLEPKTEHDSAPHRLIFELELPNGLDLTEEELLSIRRRMLGFWHELLKMIQDLRKMD